MKLSRTTLRNAAKEFRASGGEMDAILSRLQTQMETLGKGWPEMKEQDFHRVFDAWFADAAGLPIMLKHIAKDLEAIDRHLSEAEK